MVRPESKTHEAGELDDVTGYEGFVRIFEQSPNLPTPAALRYASFIASTLGVARSVATQVGDRHVRDRNAQGETSRCPATLGITSPVARAAASGRWNDVMAAPEPARVFVERVDQVLVIGVGVAPSS